MHFLSVLCLWNIESGKLGDKRRVKRGNICRLWPFDSPRIWIWDMGSGCSAICVSASLMLAAAATNRRGPGGAEGSEGFLPYRRACCTMSCSVQKGGEKHTHSLTHIGIGAEINESAASQRQTSGCGGTTPLVPAVPPPSPILVSDQVQPVSCASAACAAILSMLAAIKSGKLLWSLRNGGKYVYEF